MSKQKMKLDLSKDKCHVCGIPLERDIKTQIEKCKNRFCDIRNVDFHIPMVPDMG